MDNQWKVMAYLKIGVAVLVVVVVALLVVYQRKQARISQITAEGGLAIPYHKTLYKHFGKAIDPQIKMPVKTLQGYKDLEFLLDSGAVVSALPKTEAADMGVSLGALPRITIAGFANQKTFAYRGEMVVRIGDEDVVLPVVYSENPHASNILGRIGFFDQFNIVFSADTNQILINRRSL